jgi:hypothetical protein
MSQSEMNQAIEKAKKKPFSDFAIFCQDSAGIAYETKCGIQLDRWEVFDMGYRNVANILKGNTSIVGKKYKYAN